MNGVTMIVDGTSKHSYDDFGLVMCGCEIGEPALAETYETVPGLSWMIDLSDTVTGHAKYTSRHISIVFGASSGELSLEGIVSKLRNFCSGKMIKLIFDDDPDWYWTGRFSVENTEFSPRIGTFGFASKNADPFKHQIEIGTETEQEAKGTLFIDGVSASNITIDEVDADVQLEDGFPCDAILEVNECSASVDILIDAEGFKKRISPEDEGEVFFLDGVELVRGTAISVVPVSYETTPTIDFTFYALRKSL